MKTIADNRLGRSCRYRYAKEMDANLVNPFISATLSILKDLAAIHFTSGKPYLKKDNAALGFVTGVIEISGEGKGMVAITFEKKVILKIVSAMFEEEIQEINNEVIDAVGEITNMITGRAINALVEQGHGFDLSIPTILHGTGHNIDHSTSGPKIAVPFKTESGGFTIEVSFD